MPNSIVASTTSTFYTDVTNMLRFSYADGIESKDISAIFAWGVNKVGQSAAIADVWAALNNNGKTLDSTDTAVAAVNTAQPVFCSLRTFLLGIPSNYGPDLMADLLQLGIKVLDTNNATIVDLTTYQGMLAFETYNTTNPVSGLVPAVGRFTFTASSIVSTRQNFGTTLQNTPYVVSGSTITYLPNTYGWLWSALGGITVLPSIATPPTAYDSSLASIVTTNTFGTSPNVITIFSAFKSLVPANLVSMSLYENAGVPLAALLATRDPLVQSRFIDTNYKTGTNGARTTFDTMYNLLTTSNTIKNAYVLSNSTDFTAIYNALSTMGYQQSDLTGSTFWSGLPSQSTVRDTINQLNSSFAILDGTLSQRMSWFGLYKVAIINAVGTVSTSAVTCTLTTSMIMVKSTDSSDSVFSNVLANLASSFNNPTNGYITLASNSDYNIGATNLTLPAVALSGSNLVAFSFARVFSQIGATSYELVDSTTNARQYFKVSVSTAVINQIAVGFYDNSVVYNAAVSASTTLPAQIIALTNVAYTNNSNTGIINVAPFSTSSSLRSSLLTAVIKSIQDVNTYITNSTTKNPNTDSSAFVTNIASGVYSSSNIQQNVASIWNYPVPTASSGFVPVTIYGANPKLSLLNYIVSSATNGNNSTTAMSQLDRATLMSHVVKLVNNDTSASSQTNQINFFSILTSVSTVAIAGSGISVSSLPTGASSLAIQILVNYMTLVPSMQSDVASLLNKVLPLASLNALPGATLNTTVESIATDLRVSVFSSLALDGMSSVVAWNTSTAQSNPVSSTATFTFVGQVLEQIQIRQLSTFFGTLLDQSVVCGLKNGTGTSATYATPGLWLSFLNKSLNLAAMGYPLGNILAVTYTKAAFDFNTGAQIGTPIVVELIPGAQAVAWGYAKEDVLTYIGNPTGSV